MESIKPTVYSCKDKEYYLQYYHQHKHKYIDTIEYKTRRKASSKKYYEKNKEQILEKNSEKITCECGKTITAVNKTRHNKSEYHLKRV